MPDADRILIFDVNHSIPPPPRILLIGHAPARQSSHSLLIPLSAPTPSPIPAPTVSLSD